MHLQTDLQHMAICVGSVSIPSSMILMMLVVETGKQTRKLETGNGKTNQETGTNQGGIHGTHQREPTLGGGARKPLASENRLPYISQTN